MKKPYLHTTEKNMFRLLLQLLLYVIFQNHELPNKQFVFAPYGRLDAAKDAAPHN
jgi:hypothetical protein